MSDYDYDAAMDQRAEWEEENAQETYYEKDYHEYLARLDDEASKIAQLEEDPSSGQMDDESVVDDQESMEPDTTTAILQKIEKDTEQEIERMAEQNIPICEENCKTIMQRGADEFLQQTGRNMTYSEMRRVFG